jgi:carbonic anhydrase
MPEKTLQQLLEGNRRFVENRSTLDESASRRKAIATAQHPFAIILGCVDSRVPPELIFDQGLGELFVIRTAGEVLDKAVLGSLGFGVEELQIPLIVVLGHKNCGAIKAASEMLHNHAKAEADAEN